MHTYVRLNQIFHPYIGLNYGFMCVNVPFLHRQWQKNIYESSPYCVPSSSSTGTSWTNCSHQRRDDCLEVHSWMSNLHRRPARYMTATAIISGSHCSDSMVHRLGRWDRNQDHRILTQVRQEWGCTRCTPHTNETNTGDTGIRWCITQTSETEITLWNHGRPLLTQMRQETDLHIMHRVRKSAAVYSIPVIYKGPSHLHQLLYFILITWKRRTLVYKRYLQVTILQKRPISRL